MLYFKVMAKIRTVEDSDQVLEEMYSVVEADNLLQKKLERAEDWKARWMTLEHYILENLERFELGYGEYQDLWIRERFFYEMQQRSWQDYGFCSHFTPAFRTRTESILTDNLSLDMNNKCGYGGETLETTCNGTSREICVCLHP